MTTAVGHEYGEEVSGWNNDYETPMSSLEARSTRAARLLGSFGTAHCSNESILGLVLRDYPYTPPELRLEVVKAVAGGWAARPVVVIGVGAVGASLPAELQELFDPPLSSARLSLVGSEPHSFTRRAPRESGEEDLLRDDEGNEQPHAEYVVEMEIVETEVGRPVIIERADDW